MNKKDKENFKVIYITMKFLIMCFLVFSNYNRNNSKLYKTSNAFSIVQNQPFNKKTSGLDERYLLNNTDSFEESKIYVHLKNKFILDILQSNKISIYEKLDLIYSLDLYNRDSITCANYKAGGLLDHF